MNLFNNFKFYIVCYLIITVIFNQSYKIVAKKSINDGVLTVLIQSISVITCIVLLPLFQYKFPTDFKVYLLLFISIVFYTINDRLGTTARKGLESSTYIILKQMSTVFMIVMGVLFFKEPLILKKIIGATLIVLSNIIVFYKKENFKFNKYLLYGVIANAFLALALFLDVNNSKQFNLSFYVLLTFLMPLILILLFEGIKINDIVKEYKISNKYILILTGITWSLMMITKLKSYELGSVSVVAPITSLTVIFNVIVSYFFLKEKSNILKKIIAGILIIIAIVLIKM